VNKDLLNYIIIGVSAVVVLVLYVLFAFVPLNKRLAERKDVLVAQQKQLADAQDLVARYDEFMARMGKLQMEMQNLEDRVPSKPRIPELLKDVTRVAAECNIKDFQFAPQTVVDQENYSIQPIQLTITCDYHSLGMFVSKLAGLPRLVTTRDFQISGRDKTGNMDSISAQMTVVTYVRRTQ
jgi:type IV pilus assembly protein PilO